MVGWCLPVGCGWGGRRGWLIMRCRGWCCCRGRRLWSWRCGGVRWVVSGVAELTLQAPLVMAAQAAVAVQVVRGGDDGGAVVGGVPAGGDAGGWRCGCGCVMPRARCLMRR